MPASKKHRNFSNSNILFKNSQRQLKSSKPTFLCLYLRLLCFPSWTFRLALEFYSSFPKQVQKKVGLYGGWRPACFLCNTMQCIHLQQATAFLHFGLAILAWDLRNFLCICNAFFEMQCLVLFGFRQNFCQFEWFTRGEKLKLIVTRSLKCAKPLLI